MARGVNAAIRKSIDERWCLGLRIGEPRPHNYDGYVVNAGPDFVAIREVRDLELDGWLVLARRFISGVRDGKFEVTYNDVLRFHGIDHRVKPPAWLLRCETLKDVIDGLGRRDIWPAIETLENGEDGFYLGALWSMDDYGVWIRSYSATGKWEKTRGLAWEEIVRIEWGSAYCRTFNAYMRQKSVAKK